MVAVHSKDNDKFHTSNVNSVLSEVRQFYATMVKESNGSQGELVALRPGAMR